MYRVDSPKHRHKKLKRTIIALIILLLMGVVIYVLITIRIKPNQEIENSVPVSKAYQASPPAKVIIDKPEFVMHLPQGWKESPRNNSTVYVPRYVFSSAASQAQSIEVFIENIPSDMAINKAVVVAADGTGLSYEQVSENCTNFTDIKLKNPQTGTAPAKWLTASFTCDMANTPRHVVGMVSGDGANYVNVNGEGGASRKVFIAFTDNSINPNYATLYDILGSINFK